MRYRITALALAAGLVVAACSGKSEAPAGDANLATENVSDEALGSDNLSAVDAAPLDNLSIDNAALPADDLGNAGGNLSEGPGNSAG